MTYTINGYTFRTTKVYAMPANPRNMLQKTLLKLAGNPVIDRELARRSAIATG